MWLMEDQERSPGQRQRYTCTDKYRRGAIYVRRPVK